MFCYTGFDGEFDEIQLFRLQVLHYIKHCEIYLCVLYVCAVGNRSEETTKANRTLRLPVMHVCHLKLPVLVLYLLTVALLCLRVTDSSISAAADTD